MECFFSIYTKPFMIRQFIMTFLEITIVFAGDLHKLGIKLGQLPTGCLGTGTIPPPPHQAHPLEVNKSETCGYIHFHGGEILDDHLEHEFWVCTFHIFSLYYTVIILSTLNRVYKWWLSIATRCFTPWAQTSDVQGVSHQQDLPMSSAVSKSLDTIWHRWRGTPLINCMRQAKECTTSDYGVC